MSTCSRGGTSNKGGIAGAPENHKPEKRGRDWGGIRGVARIRETCVLKSGARRQASHFKGNWRQVCLTPNGGTAMPIHRRPEAPDRIGCGNRGQSGEPIRTLFHPASVSTFHQANTASSSDLGTQRSTRTDPNACSMACPWIQAYPILTCEFIHHVWIRPREGGSVTGAEQTRCLAHTASLCESAATTLKAICCAHFSKRTRFACSKKVCPEEGRRCVEQLRAPENKKTPVHD